MSYVLCFIHFSGSDDRLFTCLSLGDGNIGWAIDVLGSMWFICGVTMEKPRGNGIWWQVLNVNLPSVARKYIVLQLHLLNKMSQKLHSY